SVSIPRSSGFSLFELVVYIIAVAIIYATAANRFAEFPAEAERANFTAVTAQLQTAINLEMMLGVSQGRSEAAANLAGANPMDLLLEPPANYLGAFDQVDQSRLDRRVWYFDRPAQELVYLMGNSSEATLLLDGREEVTQELRLEIVAEYKLVDSQTGMLVTDANRDDTSSQGSGAERQFAGIVLRPVSRYRW
ncbi:unnamed protein product, partial [Discosporangium mesarthrocarpum]